MIELINKNKCSGCASCHNACPNSAITMKIDYSGFAYPFIDAKLCVECGLCRSVCPALEIPHYDCSHPKAFVVQNRNTNIRNESTSGGAFSGLAQQVLENNGVVFGVGMTDELCAAHMSTDSNTGLAAFRGSKYVQSDIGLTFREAESYLKSGRQVCFSGTPCQIYGLKKYLRKEYSNLFTVDVMCRAVPSPMVLKKYLAYQKEKYSCFDRITFRDKALGYSYSTLALYQGEKAVYRNGSELDPWLRLFLNGYCIRESCLSCPFQKDERASDITLCDWWDTSAIEKSMDDNKGTTGVVIWTENGSVFFQKAIKHFKSQEIVPEIILERLHSVENKTNRASQAFYDDLEKMTPQQFITKYVPVTLKHKALAVIRRVSVKLHLHNTIRSFTHLVKKRLH